MPVANDAATDPDQSSRARNKQVRSLSILLRDEFGVTFRFYDAATGGMLTPGLDEGQGRGNGVNHSYGHGSDEVWGASPMTYLGRPRTSRTHGGPPVGRREKRPPGSPIVGGRDQVVLPFPNSERPERSRSAFWAVWRGHPSRSPGAVAAGEVVPVHPPAARTAIVAEGRHRHRHRSPGRDRDARTRIVRPVDRRRMAGTNGWTRRSAPPWASASRRFLEAQGASDADDEDRPADGPGTPAGPTRRGDGGPAARGVIWVPPAADSGEALAEGESLVSPWDSRAARCCMILEAGAQVTDSYLLE